MHLDDDPCAVPLGQVVEDGREPGDVSRSRERRTQFANVEAGRLESRIHPEGEVLDEPVPADDGGFRIRVEHKQVCIVRHDAFEQRPVLGQIPADRVANRLFDNRAVA
jgi:hypothetical protein